MYLVVKKTPQASHRGGHWGSTSTVEINTYEELEQYVLKYGTEDRTFYKVEKVDIKLKVETTAKEEKEPWQCEHDWREINPYQNHYPDYLECAKCRMKKNVT